MKAYFYLRQRLIPRLIGHILKGIMRLLGWSYRFEVHGKEQFKKVRDRPTALMFWHSRTVPIIEILRRVTPDQQYRALVSNSRDGEIIASIANSYPQGGVIRVVHSNKKKAIVEIAELLKKQTAICVVTPDGPRGPAKRVKMGSIRAIQSVEGQVIPLSWSASKTWTLNTWDQMEIPKPFSKIEVWIGEPIPFFQEKGVEEGVKRVEQALLR